MINFDVPVNILPSKGNGYKVSTISIRPCSFRQLMDYCRLPSSTFIQKIRRDLALLKSDIDISTVSLLDFDAILLLKKCITFSNNKELNFEWTNAGGQVQPVVISSDAIDWTEYPDELLQVKSIILGGVDYRIKIPTLDEFEKTLNQIQIFNGDEVDYRIAVLCSCLGFNSHPDPQSVFKAVNNAIKDEILLLDKLYYLFSGSIKKIKVYDEFLKKDVEVMVSRLATDLFRCIQLNQVIPEDKIIYVKSPSH